MTWELILVVLGVLMAVGTLAGIASVELHEWRRRRRRR
jgi:hypothetical protein